MATDPTPPRYSPASGSLLARHWMAVLAGGLIGSALRAGAAMLLPDHPARFPSTGLTINLLGSFLLGLYLARRERASTSLWPLPFWAIGVLGSFTTFSAFGLEVVLLLGAGRPAVAGWYVATSVIGGLLAAIAGQRIGGALR